MFYSAENKARCVMTTIEQETGKMEPRNVDGDHENVNYFEPLLTLRKYRYCEPVRNSPMFGQAYSHTLNSLSKSLYENQPVQIIQ